MKLDSIIFDIDGTLTNSTNAIIKSWNAHLSSLDIPHVLLDEDLAGSLMGKTMDDWAMAVLPESPLPLARSITETLEQKENEEILRHGTNLYPDVKETFMTLSQDYDLFILSNCGKGYIEAVMAYAGIEEYVKGHICYGDNLLDKPDNLRKLIDEYHLKSPIYVGDTQRDYDCCKMVDIPFIFVSWGFGEAPQAPYRVDSMKELVKCIHTINQTEI